METPDSETVEQAAANYADPSPYERPYPELCAEFISALAKSVKNAALYGLAHPVVLESVHKDAALLGLVLRKTGGSLTVSFANDAWLFNDTPVPAHTQESVNMNAFFKARGLTGLTFLQDARAFELAVLCEFLGSPSRNRPALNAEKFFAEHGVTNIKPEAVRYVKQSGYAQEPRQAAPAPGQGAPSQQARPQQAPRPAPAPAPAPAPRPAPAPAPVPAPRPAPAQAKPAPKLPTGPSSAIFGGSAANGNGSPSGNGKGAPGPGGAGPALFGEPQPPKPAPKPEPAPNPAAALANLSFGGVLKGLVEAAVKDPKERVRAYEEALKMIKETMEQQISESTKAIAAEKEQAVKTRTRTEHVLARVAEGKVIVDKEGKILMMNPAAEEIAGTRLADAVGRHISEHLRPGEHFLTISQDLDIEGEKALTGGVDQRGDESVGRAMRRSVALLEDDEGRVLGTYTTLPEAAKFREAQRMQEEFLSRITHDLQSPLSSISSALEMLTDAAAQKLDDTENKFLDISIRNSRRLSQMIKSILDFSKLQSGKMDMHPQPAQVAPLVAEAVEGLIPWAKTKNITIAARPVSPDLYALADGPRIVQVITNLISNAIKATPEGGTVTVAAACDPNGSGGVLFGVRDTGHGIPKADLDKLFHKFVQLSSYDTQEGVGLGLAIVSDFVRLHGGKVWVESEEGKGATFYFTLQPAAPVCPALL